MQSPSHGPTSHGPGTATVSQSTKVFIEEFGDKIRVDNLTYLECVIAHNRGVTFKWIRDVDNISYKIFLKDQDFTQ